MHAAMLYSKAPWLGTWPGKSTRSRTTLHRFGSANDREEQREVRGYTRSRLFWGGQEGSQTIEISVQSAFKTPTLGLVALTFSDK